MTEEQIEKLLVEIRNISHGGQSGPMGIEALVMALIGSGELGSSCVKDGFNAIAEALESVADAINGLSDSIDRNFPKE